MNRIAAVVAGLSLAFVGTSASFAATINVPGDQPTIAAAIWASSDGDVIAIAAGTYYEHSLYPNGKAITIGSASGNLDVTIDAQYAGSVFHIYAYQDDCSDTMIKDLVITGGNSNHSGGGIHCDSSSPTISGCTIEGNTATIGGGGIGCFYGSSPTISDCTIKGNWSNNGAGIWCDDSSNPTITDCTIEGNTAPEYGAGIYCHQSSPTISGCTIEGNMADYHGGGIAAKYNSNVTISNCTIEGNSTTYGLDGGGIYCDQSSFTITDSVICGNSPDQLNGIASPAGSLVSSSCDILGTTGACCLGGTCITATESDCTTVGGTYAGDDVACADAGCATPPVTGACCVSLGCVANIRSDDCTALGGTWLGEGGSCDDCAATCQGDANADGVVDVFDLLKVIDGWGICD